MGLSWWVLGQLMECPTQGAEGISLAGEGHGCSATGIVSSKEDEQNWIPLQDDADTGYLEATHEHPTEAQVKHSEANGASLPAVR